VVLAFAAVRAGQLQIIGQRLVLDVQHLEQPLTGRAGASEVASIVEGDRYRDREAVRGVLDVPQLVGQAVLPVHASSPYG